MTAKDALRRDNIQDSVRILEEAKDSLRASIGLVKAMLIEVDGDISGAVREMTNSVRSLNCAIINTEDLL